MSSIILEAKSLTKEYKQTLALDHINLQIKKGKIYGFIGQNGADRTGDSGRVCIRRGNAGRTGERYH